MYKHGIHLTGGALGHPPIKSEPISELSEFYGVIIPFLTGLSGRIHVSF